MRLCRPAPPKVCAERSSIPQPLAWAQTSRACRSRETIEASARNQRIRLNRVASFSSEKNSRRGVPLGPLLRAVLQLLHASVRQHLLQQLRHLFFNSSPLSALHSPLSFPPSSRNVACASKGNANAAAAAEGTTQKLCDYQRSGPRLKPMHVCVPTMTTQHSSANGPISAETN